MGSHPPLGKGNFAAFKNGANRDRELALALIAIVQAGTVRLLLALDFGDLLRIGISAMGQIGPSGQRTASRASRALFSAWKIGFWNTTVIATIPYDPNMANPVTFVRYINANVF